MITEKDIYNYNNDLYRINENSIIIPPHKLLRSLIANYTFTNPSTMPKEQCILPTISSTIVCAYNNGQLINGLRGVNTKPIFIADYAHNFKFMFLIEFHAGGLYPFIKTYQNKIVDKNFLLNDLNIDLNQEINDAYYESNNIDELVAKLDSIFLSKIEENVINKTFASALERLIQCNGNISVSELANNAFYSKKQLNRLFVKYVGANIKTCSRIIRMKNAIELLNSIKNNNQLINKTGHYDYAHFFRDFTDINGFTPKKHKKNMSFFYNDPYKL